MRLYLTAITFIFAPACVLTSEQERLTNKHLVIAAAPWPPHIVITKEDDGKIQVEGIGWDYVKFWLDARNFTYTVVISYDGTAGFCSEPNNCTGTLGMVNRKEVDFALGNYHGCLYLLSM